ncbi:MAG: M23 family metallopeptidase [Clostridium sp.]|nr:M23 family metallopeptidase [Clostridium sp.]
MGDYRAQYEKYYNNAKSGVSRARYTRIGSVDSGYLDTKRNRANNSDLSLLQRLVRQFIWQLAGACILLILITIAKFVPVKEANDIYILAKEKVNDKYELMDAIKSIELPKDGNYKEMILDYIDEAKCYVTGQQSTKDLIKTKYITPINGKVANYEGMENSIALVSKEDLEVVSSYDGTVKEVNEGDKYIIIDHGNGVETYYGLVSNVSVKEGDAVRRGDTIAKTGKLEKLDAKGIIYKMIYMGSEKNPKEMLDLSSLERV